MLVVASAALLLGAGVAAAAVGDLDTGFYPNPDANVHGVAFQHDGSVYAVGSFSNVGLSPAIARAHISQFDETGQPVSTFGGGVNADAESIALQPDGKILVGGVFTTADGSAHTRVARFNADGTVDPSFVDSAVGGGPMSGANVSVIAVQPDGKILIGGLFATIAGVAHEGIARLNADGTPDSSFTPQVGTNELVWAIAVQPDGGIVIGGAFSAVDGVARNSIARLHADGTVDLGFDPDASGSVNALALLPDGKLLAGGSFTQIGGLTQYHLARLLPGGAIDTSFPNDFPEFDINTDPWAVTAIARQTDGRIVVGTNGDPFGGGFALRLNADGAIDSAFAPQVDSSIFAITIQDDGKVVLGGVFGHVGGTLRPYLARVLGGVPNAAPRQARAVAGDGRATVTWTAVAGAITSYTVHSAPGGRTCTVNAPAVSCVVEGLTNGVEYTFTITAANEFGTGPDSIASNPVTPVGAAGAPADASPSKDRPAALPGVVHVTGPVVVTEGWVPTEATSVTQTARRTDGATRTVRCRISASRSGSRRRYICSIRLPAGRWRLTTVARRHHQVVARGVRSVTVVQPRPVEPVTG